MVLSAEIFAAEAMLCALLALFCAVKAAFVAVSAFSAAPSAISLAADAALTALTALLLASFATLSAWVTSFLTLLSSPPRGFQPADDGVPVILNLFVGHVVTSVALIVPVSSTVILNCFALLGVEEVIIIDLNPSITTPPVPALFTTLIVAGLLAVSAFCTPPSRISNSVRLVLSLNSAVTLRYWE